VEMAIGHDVVTLSRHLLSGTESHLQTNLQYYEIYASVTIT